MSIHDYWHTDKCAHTHTYSHEQAHAWTIHTPQSFLFRSCLSSHDLSVLSGHL
ncbi:hypothetical protein WUBG_14649 [Wuchereria bancrofti]|uniref:Uncharacterized protein n=1 Tax=Wuchereria bancrofti TaxID=6293 RepID=J9AJR9_WUCBA|nr:hypothetical protein WUBG_14649 [Wuchereria bancrofti]